MYDYDPEEFTPSYHPFQCMSCGTRSNSRELFIILADGYRCVTCGAFYTFDEVHGQLER